MSGEGRGLSPTLLVIAASILLAAGAFMVVAGFLRDWHAALWAVGGVIVVRDGWAPLRDAKADPS